MLARRLSCLALVATLAGVAPDARGADPAATAFDEGTEAFRHRRYVDAASAYERAAELRPHPLPLINAAEAWERAGRLVEAATACDRALELPVSADLRRKVEARLDRLRRGLGTLDVEGPSEFQIRIDDRAPVRAPARLRVAPGRHRLVMAEQGAKSFVEREVLVGAGELHHIVLAASSIEITRPAEPVSSERPSQPPDAPAPAPAEERRGGPPTASWIAFGVGGAAAITSGVFGALTVSAKNEYDARPTHESADEFDRSRLVTNVALGVAVLAAAAGIVWWLVQSESGSGISPTRSSIR